jgi:hypothetical protein
MTEVMGRDTRKRIAFLLVVFTMIALQAASGNAEAQVTAVGEPDLSVCQNNGYKNLETVLGLTFQNEQECLLYAALGGTFGNANGTNEADFFITNLTGRNIRLNHIQYNFADGVDNPTFGVPFQWPAGTLENPSASPNWPVNSVLKLRFLYSLPVFGISRVEWVLHASEIFVHAGQTLERQLPDMGFRVSLQLAPGWNTACSISSEFVCSVSGDGVHVVLSSDGP